VTLADARQRTANLLTSSRPGARMVDELVHSRLEAEPDLARWWESMSDEQARRHEGVEHEVELPHLRAVLRLFHAWRVRVLRERLGSGLDEARILDVGDVDGLLLRALGKRELGFNMADTAIRNIRANGVEAAQGDGQSLPFADGEFDAVLCFETLEHVESPLALVDELARVCAPRGAVYVSVPWVPQTFIHPRDPSQPPGHQHIFELCRRDFHTLISHSPLEVNWESVCRVLGPPRRPGHRALLALARGSHLVAGTFHSFQFFELRRRERPA
jgi:SAM-dependent methyltransferase